jgi:hypothetical protein
LGRRIVSRVLAVTLGIVTVVFVLVVAVAASVL